MKIEEMNEIAIEVAETFNGIQDNEITFLSPDYDDEADFVIEKDGSSPFHTAGTRHDAEIGPHGAFQVVERPIRRDSVHGTADFGHTHQLRRPRSMAKGRPSARQRRRGRRKKSA